MQALLYLHHKKARASISPELARTWQARGKDGSFLGKHTFVLLFALVISSIWLASNGPEYPFYNIKEFERNKWGISWGISPAGLDDHCSLEFYQAPGFYQAHG